ncbi:3-hydroxy-5-phosphonooxypentane-2,4-dione thiolase [Desulfomonile tiedjei]|uniref:DhnA-type fructose-1,6-bisphosphate aldolase-like enzyme n=1 Tax=Desulfomonile tiedjei (strain ATCC 49306 / DSM 6799 / DCB-1) TaxID=706587 RepID=I4C0X8_DESTA|nr:3-hydroxy-5-phosphonooxypentane-2,4-dione thiolase [Desulfomonile tiedjei]AFM23219.1 DhnA-type fructose-1,6-bisphosphate aldolase-like enzyme [Desulfomonile tiedjei DSM 6799]
MADMEGFKEARNIALAGNRRAADFHLKGSSHLDWGMKNRMSRIIKADTGRTVMLAVDHGYFQGPTSGLENMEDTLAPLLDYADCLMLTRGILRTSVPPGCEVPIVLRVSGGQSVLTELSNETLTVSAEDCMRLNACGMAFSIYIGAPHEHQTLAAFADLIDAGYAAGIPVLAVTAVGRDMARDARYLSLSSRMAAEMGANIVKTYYCENFERVTGTCPVPIVMAGGKKIAELDALTMAYNAVTEGAVGVDMGRNIFQSDCPVGMIKAVRAVVHYNEKPESALKIYEDEKKAARKAS